MLLVLAIGVVVLPWPLLAAGLGIVEQDGFQGLVDGVLTWLTRLWGGSAATGADA